MPIGKTHFKTHRGPNLKGQTTSLEPPQIKNIIVPASFTGGDQPKVVIHPNADKNDIDKALQENAFTTISTAKGQLFINSERQSNIKSSNTMNKNDKSFEAIIDNEIV